MALLSRDAAYEVLFPSFSQGLVVFVKENARSNIRNENLMFFKHDNYVCRQIRTFIELVPHFYY